MQLPSALLVPQLAKVQLFAATAVAAETAQQLFALGEADAKVAMELPSPVIETVVVEHQSVLT